MWPFPDTRRIHELQDDFAKLRRDFQSLELEWSNVYDKLRKVMGRIVKSRAVIEAQEEPQPQPGNDTSTGPLGVIPTTHGMLTERQKQIQQNILRRRAGG